MVTIESGNRTGNWFHDWDVYTAPNVTNLHLHGMHVDPSGTSDNVMIRVGPGESATYEYKIPLTHTRGTYWYHPHWDGSSALQLASGMMGALIVDDDAATMPPEIAAMAEKVIVLHEVAHSGHGEGPLKIVCYFCIDNFAWPSGDNVPLEKVYSDEFLKCGVKFPWPKNVSFDFAQTIQPLDCTYLLLNGAYQPTMTLRKGEWQRWRIVQSSHQSALRFDIPGCDKVVLARDGLYFDAPRKIDGPYVITAGSRADIAVRCATAGSFSMVSLTGGIHNSSAFNFTTEFYEPVIWPRLVATLTVLDEAAANATDAPTRTPPRGGGWTDLRHEAVAAKFGVVYDLAAYGTASSLTPFENKFATFLNGGQYTINNLSYTGRPVHCMVKDAVEEWTIVNKHNLLDRWMHSFHLHTWPFQVISSYDGEAGQLVLEEHMQPGDWRDTVQIPVGGNVTIRLRPTDWTGVVPFHCHISAHQGVGMMQLVRVGESAAACAAAGTPAGTPAPAGSASDGAK